ncbi:MAG: bifunctional serine/threonine-protein kinase/ABC transporter substrate-binding protein [Pseudonocardia sp.]
MTDRRFGPYVLLELLGRGGMGEVWRAHDERRDRDVAVKLLLPQLAADGEFAVRFRAEARLVARLRDPHVVPIHDFGEIDGRLFLDMRLVEGEDLATAIGRGGPLPPARAVDIVGQVAGALTAAHADGLVHRDVKPSNILLTRPGGSVGQDFAYLVDFGLARSVDATGLTVTGQVVGTPAYMAPERLDGRADHRADVYALACVLHECLTGRVPFPVDDPLAMMFAHAHRPPPRPSTGRPEVPPGLDAVVARGMAKRSEDRYASAADLAAAARSALGGPRAAGAGPAALVRDTPGERAPRPDSPAGEAVTAVADEAAAGGRTTVAAPAPGRSALGLHPGEASPTRARRRYVLLSAMAAVTIVAGVLLAPRLVGATGGGSSPGVVRTGAGVTADTITLGVLSDTSGPFRNLGTGLVQGNQIWADDVNTRGGICGRQVRLLVGDTGYRADTAAAVYRGQQPDVLGYLQVLGSPINSALEGDLVSDQVMSLALSWSSSILDNEYQIVPGTTYDLEMINGLAYLQQQGRLADGDTLGHIFIGGEYGENGLLGAETYAQQHGMTVREARIAATDTDMSDIVAGFRSAGVDAILLTTTPAQTASALNAAAVLGLDLPVLGNSPTFDPATNLAGPAAATASDLFVTTSSAPYSSAVARAGEVRQAFVARYPDAGRNSGVPYGYAGGLVWEQILTSACDAGDLTRAGVRAAFLDSADVGTDDLVAGSLDFSQTGAPPSRSVYVARADPTQEGGLLQVTDVFTAPEAQRYVAPHQKPS